VKTTARIAPAAMATGSRQGARSGAHAGVQQRGARRSGPGRTRRPRQELISTVHGGAIIVRQEQGETGCARAGVQGVVGDLLLPSRSAATGEHGDEIEPGRGRWPPTSSGAASHLIIRSPSGFLFLVC